MEGRWFRVAALVEWVIAAAAVLFVVWIGSVPIQRAFGSGVEAAVTDAALAHDRPPGVPAGAAMVPVMLLLDGREVRQGDLRTRLDSVLPPKLADGPPVVSAAQFGERHTRVYRINNSRVYIVCERSEPNGAMKVSGIYLP